MKSIKIAEGITLTASEATVAAYEAELAEMAAEAEAERLWYEWCRERDAEEYAWLCMRLDGLS